MTLNFPSGRSRSIPLRLFWRAPRISTQPRSGGAVTQGFSAVVEPTGDYPIARSHSQIFDAKNRVSSVAVALWATRARRGISSSLARRTPTRLQKSAAEPFRHFLAFGQQPLGHVGLERL